MRDYRTDDAGSRIAATVIADKPYQVELVASGESIDQSCSCTKIRHSSCRHVVALALRYLDELAHSELGLPDNAFATRTELNAWAAEHQVEFELRVAADVLFPEIADDAAWHLRHELCLLSIGDIAHVEGAQRALHSRTHQARALVAVRRRLDERAAEVRDGIAEERQRDAKTSSAATANAAPVMPLIATLRELRVEQRALAAPRSRAARAAGRWKFAAHVLAIEWDEPVQLRGSSYAPIAIAVRLGFTPKPSLACSCSAPGCTHALALIDDTLDRLDRGDADAYAAATEFARPPWQRALAELAKLGEIAKQPAPIELWWQVEREYGMLTVTPLVKRQLKQKMSSGARMSAQRVLREYLAELAPRDREIAEHVEAWRTVRTTTTYPVKAFAALVGHPRVVFDGVPIAVKRVPLGFTAIAAAEAVRMEPSVDGARIAPQVLLPLLRVFGPDEPVPILEAEHGRLFLVDASSEARQMCSILNEHGDAFPPEAQAELIERLARLKLPVDVPTALLGDRITEPAVVVLRLRLEPDASLELEPFIRPAVGAPLYPPGCGPRDVLVPRDGGRAYAHRDLAGEPELVARALAALPLGSASEGPPGCYHLDDPEAALAVVAAVQSPPDGIVAEWVDGRTRVVPSGGAQQLRIQIDHKRDWFGINGELKVEQGRIELAVLLDAARRQRRFVRLDDHSWVELEHALRDRLAELADRAFEPNRGAVEVSIAAVPAVRALADDGARVAVAPAWQKLAENLAVATNLRLTPPKTLGAELRPYQRDGYAWLARLAAWGAGAVLADDMGLGKTVQAIALLCARAKCGPAIVLAPTSVALNWLDELRRFAPALRPIVYGEAADRAQTLAALGKRDVLIVSYGLLLRDANALAAVTFATLIADEAQAIKNPRTERAKAARALAAEFRVALTGTPLENHLGELWSLFALVFPGLLGSWEQFRSRYALPIEKRANATSATRDDDERGAAASAALARVIKPFLLRRTKAEVAPELPPRTEIEVPVALSSEEAELYEDARLAAVARLTKSVKTDEQKRFEVLAALTRLRLCACHPKLYDPASTVSSAKLARLLELVEQLRSEGHRALVFSQFTSHLALVRSELGRAGVTALYLDGKTPPAERKRLIEQFQAGTADVFLISLKAGGTGINLTAADYVIHLDPWWNPAVEDQATDRAHRIGQDKPVTVYRLIARNTVEEKILSLHATKRALVAGVLAGTDAAAQLSTRDLVDLIAAQGS